MLGVEELQRQQLLVVNRGGASASRVLLRAVLHAVGEVRDGQL
jgi:molybdate-binding protein